MDTKPGEDGYLTYRGWIVDTNLGGWIKNLLRMDTKLKNLCYKFLTLRSASVLGGKY